MATMNWLQRIAWNDEVFIDEDGFAHGASGGDDAGQDKTREGDLWINSL